MSAPGSARPNGCRCRCPPRRTAGSTAICDCAACAAVAAEYAAQQASLRGLEEPLPPRDLWARIAAGLDRAERQAGRDLPNTSVFPGRGGTPGSRGARSIRGLRAEQRASAFRSGARAVPPHLGIDRRSAATRPPGLAWIAPFGALAALAIVIVVGGNAVLTGTPVTPIRSPLSTSATFAAANATPFATPIQVGAGEVAWLTPADDGTYSINFASVDQVCPANAKPDCAPIAPGSPRHLPTVGSTLHTVIRSPSHKQLVVVPASTKKRSGGSVIVVAVPTPVPPSGAPGSAVASPPAPPDTPVATASAPVVSSTGSLATPSGSATPTDPASAGTSVAPATAGASPSSPSPTEPAASETATPSLATDAASPTAATTEPSSTDAIGPTPSAASESPSATEPQPTSTALAIISDVVVVGETASYSPDGTMLAFSARPADGSQGPDIYLWRPGDAIAHAVTTDHASVFSGWLNNQLLGSRAVDGAGRPASIGHSPSASTEGGASGQGAAPTDQPSDAPPSAIEPSPSASDAGASASAESSDGSADSNNTRRAVAVNVATGAVAADVPQAALARSFVLDPITLAETELAAPAWRPVVDPTGRFVAYWAGSLRSDDTSLSWIPDRGAIVLASWPALRGSEPGSILAPVPLLDNGGAVPAGEWDIRWDESGAHIAIWAADAENPDLGRLTLLTIDATGRVDPAGISLHDAPALAGFSMGSDRLAWATPPGQDGQGSRLQVLAWSGENAGNIDSQPVTGGDAVVVVR